MKTAPTIVAASLALLLASCEDPEFAQREQAQLRLDEAAAAIGQAARQASLDRVAAAEDIRAAAARAQGIAGGSAGQLQAAAALVASARTQAALLELGRLNQIESANRANRGLALGLARAAGLMQLHIEAHNTDSVRDAAAAIAPQGDAADADLRARASRHDELAARVAQLQQENQEALGQAEAILVEAEATRQRGLGARRGEITIIAEEAGRQRDEARGHQSRAAHAEVDLSAQGSFLRLSASETDAAKRRAEQITQALAAIQALAGQYEVTGTEGGEIIANLCESVGAAVASTDPAKNEAWSNGIERLTGDLDAADGAAGQANASPMLRHQVNIARARALMAQGEASFQHALLLHELAGIAAMASTAGALEKDAQTALTTSQEFARQAIDAYTLAKDGLNGSGETSPESAALVLTIERAIASIGTPSFEARAAPTKKATGPAAPPDDEPSPEFAEPASAAGMGGPPFASLDALASFVSGHERNPDHLIRAREAYQASSPEAQSLLDAIVGMTTGIAEIQIAAREKFGSTSVGPMFDQIAATEMASASVSEANDEVGSITFSGMGNTLVFKAAKTEEGWKVDVDATMAAMTDEDRAKMTAGFVMMAPMAEACKAVAAQVRSGEIASAAGIQAALMKAMQSSMPGMPGQP